MCWSSNSILGQGISVLLFCNSKFQHVFSRKFLSSELVLCFLFCEWVFFLVSMLCFVHVCQVLMKYNSVNKFGPEAQALYQKVSSMTIVLWSLYPAVWVVAEGTRMISPSLEACCYMIMDVLSKCLFGFMIVQARGALERVNGYETI